MKKISLSSTSLNESNKLSMAEKRGLTGGQSYSCGNLYPCDCTYNPDGSIATYTCCNQLHRVCML